MEHQQNRHKYSFRAAVVLYCAVLAGLVLYGVAFNPPPGDPAHLGGNRSLVIIFLSTLACLLLARSWRVSEIIRNYFHEIDHPINLSIFRIFLFGYFALNFDGQVALFYSGFPKELLFPPYGSGWMIDLVPINESWAGTVAILFKVFCWMAMLGLYTRFSATMAALLFFYIGGVPQFFGKVNHYHNLLWFMAVLAVSRCADYLSLDSIRQAFRQADRGQIEPPQASRIYAVPLRFIWLLFGVAYFGPGFWKIWKNGVGWIVGDNLKLHMYYKWMDFDGWVPGFRIDQYPWLYRTGGAMTIVIELGFIFLVFFPVWRWVAIAGGFSFHLLTGYFMRIAFTNLRNFYIAFVPWEKCLGWVGRRVFVEEMTLYYDGNCGICRRTIAATRRFDLLERVRYINALSKEGASGLQASGISQDEALRDMQAVIGSRIVAGYDAYRWLAWRIPLLWPIAPVLYLWPVTQFGRAIYRRVADSRACQLMGSDNKSVPETRAPSMRPVFIVGTILVAVNLSFGLLDIGNGWPFAGYPTFAQIASKQAGSLEVELVMSDGSMTTLENRRFADKFSPERFTGLILRILYGGSRREERLNALWSLMVKTIPELAQVRQVHFYEVMRTTNPEEKHLNPLRRRLIYQMQLN